MSFKSIEESIRNYVPNAVMGEIVVGKVNRPLLFVSTKPSIRSLKVFDESGLNEIAEIRYNINNDSVYISSIRVNVDYQGMGVGRAIFNFAMAHADAMGAKKLYGTASPTDPIKGVSSDIEECYDKELETIKSIYVKLGCRFIDDENFVQGWKPGEKITKIDSSFKKMIDEWVKRDTMVM